MRFVLWCLGTLLLAAGLTAGWLFRHDLMQRLPPEVARVGEALGAGGPEAGPEREAAPAAQPVAPGPGSLTRVRDKVDSLHGWGADSVLLSPREVASLLVAGLPPAARERLDSVRVSLGDGRVTIAARLETASIPASALGPLAGALEPWEAVTGSGIVAATRPGWAEWRVDALTLRGFTLPAAASRNLISRSLPGAQDGAVPFALPEGIARIRVRPGNAVLYREGR